MTGQITSIQNGILFILPEEPCNLKPGIEIEFKVKQHRRTEKQHRFYHRYINWVIPYYQEYDLFWDHDSLHEHFKELFLRVKAETVIGWVDVMKSTTKIGIMEFCEFMDKCLYQANVEALAPVELFQKEYDEWKIKNIISWEDVENGKTDFEYFLTKIKC